MSRRSAAFTLIELMVVVSIIIVLVLMLLPTLAKARDESLLVKCQTNMRAIGTAFATYCQQNQDLMPQSAAWKRTNPIDTWPINPSVMIKTREQGWQYPSQSDGWLNLSWSDALYIDYDVETGFGNKAGNWSARKTGEDPNNGKTWANPLQYEKLFICPKHPEDQRRGDGNTEWGYAMTWCATSDLTMVVDANGNPVRPMLPVRSRSLVSYHAILTEGNVYMGTQGGYLAPSTNNFGIFQRHRRNQTKGANYLMADNSVVWSDLFANTPSPLSFNNDYSSPANRQSAAKAGYIFAHGVSMQR